MEKRASDRRLEILDLPDEMRALVSECELTGLRTQFDRNGRPAAILVSYDEYLALQETIAVGNDEGLRGHVRLGDEQAAKGALMLPEDLFGQ